MNTIYLGLGANVGDKKKHIQKAIELLSQKITHLKQASLYESKAVGYTDQDNFINTVVSGKTDLAPQELLVFAKAIEKEIGRIYRFRWGPREIDIDILFYNDRIIKQSDLEIPHPRLHQRDFVLVPLNELASDMMHPVFKKTIRQLLQAFPPENKSIIASEVGFNKTLLNQ
ncbi:MAG: 2-amino-4-hydroxy-6-hydroxymethyldihydropteridine pyrophosphokinase [Candidatus Gottesmanbacteria bacterium GW2011_GWB1_43_11]|uniref:2-amino-4-hydroxy-6-hydroxymethyldihydropteridine diphosphokinase n=1 Tax=Candidatus Gottesmanbacteria bacterium GW2011_GWB1_43_11 TaxID=1618446 RepID=A0A0G1CHL8_9BACT|nr:MAG: 2-amino-4-hydroxy-6-hydroxymethyldihydropteridine pyrophosphokinase [Candidatus Gottesmanbacteria bacterium GW2011_GWA2_42_16]KKS54005.1 MAG: 2-amino-4-hydroxy-6-hydroxymethyldihydropteridine pyrophosphokinase [Candidatus Gottesmanbacteria bacterium GW2011_GWA1_42_26]KKS80649.1 MAG: 2-amino-4-hydroxy-6-hydroxymethyldihydropteridine pyrophosphokinase [Candidatus Gottesmanbacteria bacterium GW2011_GWC1_43_10]KKS85007.1 MAG: 2-amino-4-hydroxy-6-hydroxymethyldihydropteridine pyrophosphokinas